MPEENERKPMLTVPEQIEHLKGKGVTFDLCPEDAAAEYLTFNNNYFKLASYRKNYDKYTTGERAGKYVNLDFAYLRDLAIIDMQLRYACLPLCLDIEHYAKMELLRQIASNGYDGYSIVEQFFNSLSPEQLRLAKHEVGVNIGSVYYGGLLKKYGNDPLPVWVYLEIVPFGRLVSFYKFFSEMSHDPKMKTRSFLLRTCKDIRNASAHNNCVLNDLHPNSATHSPSSTVLNKLSRIPGLSRGAATRRMSNARIEQVTTLLYLYPVIVSSPGVSLKAAERLRTFDERMVKNIDFYNGNQMIQRSLLFIDKVIKNWFPAGKN